MPRPSSRSRESAITRLVLYSRQYCHLCHDMLAALEEMHIRRGGEFEFDVDVMDVDADPALTAKYDELVPVLEANGRELCHYFLDPAKVSGFLRRCP